MLRRVNNGMHSQRDEFREDKFFGRATEDFLKKAKDEAQEAADSTESPPVAALGQGRVCSYELLLGKGDGHVYRVSDVKVEGLRAQELVALSRQKTEELRTMVKAWGAEEEVAGGGATPRATHAGHGEVRAAVLLDSANNLGIVQVNMRQHGDDGGGDGEQKFWLPTRYGRLGRCTCPRPRCLACLLARVTAPAPAA